MTDKRLEEIIIKRTGDSWTITRRRKDNGESCTARDLEEAFDFVRAIYDKKGEFVQHALDFDDEENR